MTSQHTHTDDPVADPVEVLLAPTPPIASPVASPERGLGEDQESPRTWLTRLRGPRPKYYSSLDLTLRASVEESLQESLHPVTITLETLTTEIKEMRAQLNTLLEQLAQTNKLLT
jgi:membrane-anchored protein YejM (alkaline phosphatase superfamily)